MLVGYSCAGLKAMQRSWRQWVAISALVAGFCLPMLTALAAAPGWSTSFDPRKRVFLSFRSVEDGPRDLLLACLRDVDTLTIDSEAVADAGSNGQKVTLTLTNGAARYAIDGEISPDPDSGAPGFSADIDLDAQTMRRLRHELLPVLEGKGLIQLTVGSAHRELPVSGLAAALKRFKSTCFGTR
jgi:hypothetical protein